MKKNGFFRLLGFLLSLQIAAMMLVIPVPCMRTGAAQLDWNTYLKKDASWYGSSEGTAFADMLISKQQYDGGWRKDMDEETTGSWAKSTIDNDATTSQITVLARTYRQTGNEKYKNACLKGIDLLINGQYDNGGWPQCFNDPGTYHAHITYNDTAIVRVLNLLRSVSKQEGDFDFIDSSYASRAQNSINKGIQCILDTQIKVNGVRTAWGQQHDEFTLAPASARAYELPSICAGESAGIVNFLKTIENPSREVIEAINAAITWFDEVKLTGVKWVTSGDDKVLVQDANASPLWARFYEIGTNRPMFADRDGSVHYNVAEISKERRTGYSWYGTWPAKIVAAGLIDDPLSRGNHIYVDCPDKSPNYDTIREAVAAAAEISPSGEDERVYIHIAPGLYREQVQVKTPFVSFVNEDPTQKVTITWYYGIGYKYYSVGSDGHYNAANAAAKSSKEEPKNRWGCSVGIESTADYFRAENITFENSFNRYVTDEELADGVEVSHSQSINYYRAPGIDVTSKAATERAAAISIEGGSCEFYKCEFLGSQDTLYTGGNRAYFRECLISGNTDYVFGLGTMTFDRCELKFAGYSNDAVGGYITAAKSNGKFLFRDCTVTSDTSKKVSAGYFGRPWGSAADVAFVNTKLASADLINSAGWTSMSGNDPAAANFKEYNTTFGGIPVNTSGRVANTVKSSDQGLALTDYFNGWVPYYYDFKGQTVTLPSIDGKNISALTPKADNPWSIDDSAAVGDKIYSDREYVFTSIPNEVVGGEIIVLPCDLKSSGSDLATFKAKGNITVYAAFDTRVDPRPSWVSDWEDTGLKATSDNDVTFVLLKKNFASGEKVTLGKNGQSSYCMNYTVFVTADTSRPVIGDVNADGQFDSADLVTLQKWLNGSGELANWQAGDLCSDGRIDVFDMVMMRKLLVNSISETAA